jgi:hypothetical protein
LGSGSIYGCSDGVSLDRTFLKEIGQLGSAEAVLMSQRERVVSSGLTMSARRGGVPSGVWCIPYEGIDIARLRGVVDQPAGVSVRKGGRPPLNPPSGVKYLHSGEHSCVEFQAAGHGQGIGNRAAGQLMTEWDLARKDREESPLFGGGDCWVVAHQSVEELAIHRRRDHGEQLNRILMRRSESTKPAEYGIDYRGRHARADCGGHQFVDEIRVSVTQGVDLVNVQEPAGDQFAYRRLG